MGCVHQGQNLLSMTALLLLPPGPALCFSPYLRILVLPIYNRKIIRNDNLSNSTNNSELEDHFSNTLNMRTRIQTVTGSQLPRDCNTHIYTHATVLRLSGFCAGQSGWISIILYLLPPSTAMHGILPVQFTCLTVLLHTLCPSFLSTSWSGTLHFKLHTFLHPIIVIFVQHNQYHCNLFCCSTKIISSNPSHSLNSLLGNLLP